MKIMVPLIAEENDRFTEEAAESLIGKTFPFFGANGEKYEGRIVQAELENEDGSAIVMTLEVPDRADWVPTF